MKHVEFDIAHIVDYSNIMTYSYNCLFAYLQIWFVSSLIDVNNVLSNHELLVKDQKIIINIISGKIA